MAAADRLRKLLALAADAGATAAERATASELAGRIRAKHPDLAATDLVDEASVVLRIRDARDEALAYCMSRFLGCRMHVPRKKVGTRKWSAALIAGPRWAVEIAEDFFAEQRAAMDAFLDHAARGWAWARMPTELTPEEVETMRQVPEHTDEERRAALAGMNATTPATHQRRRIF